MYLREPYPNELYHHGIKGQKWGIRRWQNEDGSLTAAGREHYGLDSGDANKETRGYKRVLNAMEKARAADVSGDIRYTEKANRARNDLNRKANIDEAKKYRDSIKTQDEATNKIISELKKKGYNHSSKDTIRAINDGNAYLATLIGGLPGAVLYNTGKTLYNKNVYGTKYSAKVNGRVIDQTPDMVASKKHKVTRD